MSVKAAITAIMPHQQLSLILKACIAFTGDVDTVATIALGAASCSPEIENDLPAPLLHRLERSQYGYDYLAELDRQLLEMINHSS